MGRPSPPASSATVEALASVLDPLLITACSRRFDRDSKRMRKLPAKLVLWLVVAMCLYRHLSIDNVLYRLVQGLGA